MAVMLRKPYKPELVDANNKKACKYLTYRLLYSAEREGFEPTVGSSPTAVFKTAAINRSAISP